MEPADAGAAQFAYARARADKDAARSLTNAAPAESLFGLEERGSAKANTAAVAAAPSATAMTAPESADNISAGSLRQPMAEQAARRAEPATLDGLRKSGAAGESLVRVTLLFPRAESPVSAAPPASGAAKAVTPQ